MIDPLRRWANQYRVHVRKDTDDSHIIPGRHGSIWAYSDAELAVTFTPDPPSPRRWPAHRSRALTAGMRLHQNGDAEGSFRFDPTNPIHSGLALAIAQVKRKRNPNAAQHLAPHRFARASTTVRRTPSDDVPAA